MLKRRVYNIKYQYEAFLINAVNFILLFIGKFYIYVCYFSEQQHLTALFHSVSDFF